MPLTFWYRILPARAYVKGWKISLSHHINQDLRPSGSTNNKPLQDKKTKQSGVSRVIHPRCALCRLGPGLRGSVSGRAICIDKVQRSKDDEDEERGVTVTQPTGYSDPGHSLGSSFGALA